MRGVRVGSWGHREWGATVDLEIDRVGMGGEVEVTRVDSFARVVAVAGSEVQSVRLGSVSISLVEVKVTRQSVLRSARGFIEARSLEDLRGGSDWL